MNSNQQHEHGTLTHKLAKRAHTQDRKMSYKKRSMPCELSRNDPQQESLPRIFREDKDSHRKLNADLGVSPSSVPFSRD